MPQAWKLPHLAKGLLTWVPPLAAWRARRGEHAAPARYCYAVWLRHLVLLARHGFPPAPAAPGGPRARPGGGGEPTPDERESPLLRPRLDGYAFPDGLVDRSRIAARTAAVQEGLVAYHAPWRLDDLAPGSLDPLLPPAVLPSVDDPGGGDRA